MRLRTKILIVLLAAFVLYTAVVAVLVRSVLQPTLIWAEQQYVGRAIERCRNLLELELDRIDLVAADSASRDDTYRFLGERDPADVETAFTDAMLFDHALELVYLVDRNGDVAWSMFRDLETGERGVADVLPPATWPADHPLREGADPEIGRAGLWPTPAGIGLLSAWPVHRPDRGEPPVGLLVVGRMLDGDLLERLTALAGVRLRIEAGDGPARPDPSVRIARSSGRVLRWLPAVDDVLSPAPDDVEFYRTRPGMLLAAAPLEDFRGDPTLTLSIETDRLLVASGMGAILIAFGAVLAIAGLTSVLLLTVLSATVTRPLDNLMKHLLVIREGDYLTAKLKIRSGDEVGQLASEYNNMLGRLQADYEKRMEAEDALRSSQERYRQLAIHDDLTGLFNTRYLYQTLEKLFDRARRKGTPLSLVFIDIDRFKKVVDTYGHLNGSQAIAEVATILVASIDEPCFGVSYGGDEYVLVLPGFDKAGALAKAEEIRSRVASHVFLKSRHLHVRLTLSLGIANYPEDAQDMTGLLGLADAALFYVKDRGRNAVGDAVEAVQDAAGKPQDS